jgi:hypothetical protein
MNILACEIITTLFQLPNYTPRQLVPRVNFVLKQLALQTRLTIAYWFSLPT